MFGMVFLNMKLQLEIRTIATTINIVKEYLQAVYCHPAYLTYRRSTSWGTLGWRKDKLESRLLGEISITSDTQMTTPLWQKWRTKQPLDGSEGGEWKSWLKAQIQKTRIMASGPITSWQLDGETVADFIFLGSNITADHDYGHEIKRHSLEGKLWPT